MSRVTCRQGWTIAMCAIPLLLCAHVAAAQAFEVARRGSEITAFGEGLYLKPDWGGGSNTGFATGVDVTPFVAPLLQPSFEIRFTNGGGAMNTERTVSAGLKLAARVRRFHPYGIYQEGLGMIYFKHPSLNSEGKLYQRDQSKMHVWGGGMEIDVRSLWQIRAEATKQDWNLDPPEIHPVTISVGVTYRLPFHNGKMQ